MTIAPSHGLPWLPEQDAALLADFRAGADLKMLAEKYGRSLNAIRHRLEILELNPKIGASPHAPVDAAPSNQSSQNVYSVTDVRADSVLSRSRPEFEIEKLNPIQKGVIYGIEKLINELDNLKQLIGNDDESYLRRSAIRNVGLLYRRLDTALLNLAIASDDEQNTNDFDDYDSDDPIPDRLRNALKTAFDSCVSDHKDRYIAQLVSGLICDGSHTTLATVGEKFGVTRERIRQRRVRAFRMVNATIQRRPSSATRIRNALKAASSDTDWTQPEETARLIAKLVSDRTPAVRQLTAICCRAAGSTEPLKKLASKSAIAANEACRDPDVIGKWRLDRWEHVKASAFYPPQTKVFDAPPPDLVTPKRQPFSTSPSDLILFKSRKLGRHISCESYCEERFFSWLEKSEEVIWYCEQPISIPYMIHGTERFYYPDAVVMDASKRLTVVEVKPLFMTYREETLRKVHAAIEYFSSRGIGYLIVDTGGRTLLDYAARTYDKEAAHDIEKLIDIHGFIPFGLLRQRLENRPSASFDFKEFVSMVINRDWAVSYDTPIRISKFSDGLTFAPLLRGTQA